jgi:phosphohistidine phosphatase
MRAGPPEELRRTAARRGQDWRPGSETMKRQLFLLRHAKSSWDDPSIPDHDRPLNKRGRKAAATMRQFIRSEGIRPDLVCVSSARRALQTLEALGPWDRPPSVEIEPELYLARSQKILELVHDVPPSSRVVMVIGHNPGLQDFATLLAGDSGDALVRRLTEAFPTGAMAKFKIDGDWSQVAPGSGRLTRLVTPRELTPPA